MIFTSSFRTVLEIIDKSGPDGSINLFSLDMQQTDIKFLLDVKELKNTNFFAVNSVIIDEEHQVKDDDYSNKEGLSVDFCYQRLINEFSL